MLNRKKLTFDFNEAVAEARRDYPAETALTTFIKLPSFGWRRKVRKWVTQVNGAPDRHLTAKMIQDMKANATGYTSSIAGSDGRRFTLIAMSTREPRRKNILYSLSFAFNHELGHVVASNGMPNGRSGGVTKEHEGTADIFALLRGVKQGSLTAHDAFALANDRACERRHGDPHDDAHDTAGVVRRLAHQMEQVDVSALTHAEIKTIASRYGASNKPRI